MRTLILVIILFFIVQSVQPQIKFKEVKTAQDVIDNYITAIGGADRIAEIKSETLRGDINIGGMECGFFIYKNDTINFTKAEGFAHGENMILLQSLTTNNYAWEYQMGGLKEFEDEDLLNKQEELVTGNINFILNYDKKGYVFELKEPDSVNGKLCYKLELSKDGKVLRTNFYDPETFYLIKFTKPNNSNSELDDYREVSGVYKPFKIIQKSPMELTIQYKEFEFNKDIDVNLLSKPTNK